MDVGCYVCNVVVLFAERLVETVMYGTGLYILQSIRYLPRTVSYSRDLPPLGCSRKSLIAASLLIKFIFAVCLA